MTEKKWWQPEIYAQKRAILAKRERIIRTIRTFFERRGFSQVQTPVLQVCPGMEVHIKTFETQLLPPFELKGQPRYLHTSPELTMKKLLVAGEEKIFQLCPTFRNAEEGETHFPEFTMLEWYRIGTTYTKMMQDTIDLVRSCAKAVGCDTATYNGKHNPLFKRWEKLTVAQAFQKYAHINLWRTLPAEPTLEPDPKALRKEAEKQGIQCSASDRFEDIFFRIMFAKIEPHLGEKVPTILYDYPTCLGALARKSPKKPLVCERFEAYVCGLELCNAFSELTDAKEQAQRFHYDQQMQKKLYGTCVPIDTDFLQALEQGMPACAGNAVGVDRLIMLLTGQSDIHAVLWVPKL